MQASEYWVGGQACWQVSIGWVGMHAGSRQAGRRQAGGEKQAHHD